jgi:Bacterial SH3 domain
MGYLKPHSAEMAQPIPIRVTMRSGPQSGANGQRLAHLKREAKVALSGPDEHALVRIAERFAPGTEPVFAPAVQSFGRRVAPARLMVAALPGVRTLMAVLIVVALLPSVVLATMLWYGAVSASWFETPSAETKGAGWSTGKPAAVMANLDGTASWQATDSVAPRLEAPAALEAHPHGEVPFAIALDTPQALPARSVIAVGGLPRGVTLSAGRPFGDSDWNLRPDETGDLRLVVADAAAGEATLRLRLIAGDGDVVAATDTALKVTADAPAPVTHALPAVALYEPSPFGLVAWDEDATGSIGIAELITDGPTAPPPAQASPSPPDATAARGAEEAETKWIEPSAWVNLRKGPSSSSVVVGVIAKGTKLSLEGRRRGWMRVTDPKTAATGWIYAGNVAGETVRRTRRRAADAGAEDNSETLWSGLGSWLGR